MTSETPMFCEPQFPYSENSQALDNLASAMWVGHISKGTHHADGKTEACEAE